MTKMKMRAKERVGELEDDKDTSENDGGTSEMMETMETMETMEMMETMETLGDDGDKAGDNGDKVGESLLMDRAMLGARVRWEPNLTETERESRSLFLF